jgi:hypothetical protein
MIKVRQAEYLLNFGEIMKSLYRMNRRTLLLSIGLLVFANFVSAQCSFTGLNSNYCVNSPTSALSGTVPGAFFVGPGVVGSSFSPSVAGTGTHVITYSSSCSYYAITQESFAPVTFTGSSVSLSDDAMTGSLSIGFTFQFFCNNYTAFYISSNGFITFSSGQPDGCCTGQVLPDNNTPNNLIALAWEDWNPGNGGTITYTTLGSSPNRTLFVRYASVPHYGNGGSPLTAQLQLHESTNIIAIHTTSMTTDGGGHTMGLENSGGTAAFVVSGRNSSGSWSAANECYRFTPGTNCTSTQTTVVSPSTITVAGSNSICSGSSTTLTATGNTSYTWSTVSGTLSNSASIIQTPTAITTYSVDGINSFGCVAKSAITVTVDNTPTVTAVSTATGNGVCPGATVALSGGGATSYSWTGGISNGVPFAVSGQSSFTVTGANACGTAQAVANVSIHPVPSVTATVSQPTICSGSTATFVGTSGSNPPAVSYFWQAANNNNPSNGVGYFATVSQNYTVTGTSALGCTAQAVTALGVTQTPILAPVSNPPLICIGNTATISVSGAAGYSWAPVGTFTGSSAPSITVDPTSTTTYTITKWTSNCVDTKTVTITVNQLPFVFAVGSTTVVCAGKPATLSVGGGITYTWTSTPSVNLPSGAQANNIVVTPLANTNYTVAASDGTCVNTTTLYMQVDPNPTINIATTASVLCRNECATLTLSGADTYTWAPSTITGTLAVVCPTAPISYSVGGTNSFGCVSSKQQVIVVNQLPNISISAQPTLVCTGGASKLTSNGTPGPVSYSWSSGANTATTMVNPVSTTVYEVTVAINNTGCRDTRTVQVGVYQPTFCVTNTAVCYGGTVTICAGCAQTYTWANPPSGFACVPVSPSVTTIYTVAASSTSNNVQCSSSQTLQVDIYSQPTVSAVAQRTLICRYEEVDLFAGGANTYTWSNSMQGGTITVKPLTQTTYSVVGTDVFGCRDTNFVVIKVSTCPGIKENVGSASIEVFPNPSNGTFIIKSEAAADLTLINELGQAIRKISLTAANSHQVSISGLAAGIYFITDSSGDGEFRRKIIVAK